MTSLVLAAAAHLVLLHQADGADLVVNPTHVVALHAAASGQANKAITPAARCAVGMSSGKFYGVTETCEAVRRLLEAAQ
jgi:hypothetical protein